MDVFKELSPLAFDNGSSVGSLHTISWVECGSILVVDAGNWGFEGKIYVVLLIGKLGERW